MRPMLPVLALLLPCAPLAADSWPQFRGPNASGLAVGGQRLPAELGPEVNVVWKTPLPPGHSSPVIAGERIFLTAERGGSLLTIAVERSTGKVLWEREARHSGLEEIHQIGSHAQASPATDGKRVVSFFGSAGIFAYDLNGNLLWSRPLGPFKNTYGAGSSPVIHRGRVILNQDHDTDSFLMAFDLESGETIWKTERAEFPRGYATPVIWETGGGTQIVVSGTLRVVGYDFASGEELWTVIGIARIVTMTPVVGGDGILYVAAWAPGGDEGERIEVEPFDKVAATLDADQSGTLEKDEIPEGPLKSRFPQIDRDKDGRITKAEYEDMRRIFDAAQNIVLAIRPGGRGDISCSHVLWTQRKLIPYVPSPLYHDGRLFMVKNGGIFSSLDAKTGEPLKQGRVSGRADYYSSPVAGDGKIYLLSRRGELTVVSAEAEWKELSTAELGEEAFATPAIAGGRIYLRTQGHLYAFGIGDAEARGAGGGGG
jgi:outer membrane protein assembly factor BamB